MMAEYAAPRGTRDILPAETQKWQYVESVFRDMCALYGFEEIRTPTFEHTELFVRNLGETTDVVSKEMYNFETKGGRKLTLRPEGTAPTVRAYVTHNLGAVLPVNKVYYIARIFRFERPQAGRYREHTQLGVEVFGSIDPALDAEVISFAAGFFREVGIDQFELKLNTIGCPKCRPEHRKALLDFVESRLGDLCETCRDRYERNPLRMLDCKEERCQAALTDAPVMIDYVCEECRDHFAKVRAYLTEMAIPFVLDNKLVRGFDYYTKTAFEFVSGELGAQNAIGGGGRYDNLVEEIGGAPTPAIGFGLGLDRLLLTLDAMQVQLPLQPRNAVFVAGLGEAGHEAAVKTVCGLRKNGVAADMDYTGRSLKAQMKVANKLGARFVVIIGDDEIAGDTVTLRDMSSSEQKSLPTSELVEYIKSR
ncbi:MAG: histidine--tRNA ligase [Armatimonadetes bacterium]|jgi:histidyl-tRNA synthetase|nr:histidine--tRNA ligase [Armatimonadota bacterium]